MSVYCHHWFIRLSRHTPRCKSLLSTSQPSSVPSGSSSSGTCQRASGVEVAAILVDAAYDLDSSSPGDEPPDVVDDFHCNSSGPEYPDAESRAWGILSQISVSDIIFSCTVTTITKIPAGASTLYQDCCAIPLKRISVNPADPLGWLLLLLLPRMVLRNPKRGGKAQIAEVRSACRKFLNYQWEDLIQLNLPTHGSKSNGSKSRSDNHRVNAALRLVKCGEVSRAGFS